jgi:hypothetical protein
MVYATYQHSRQWGGSARTVDARGQAGARDVRRSDAMPYMNCGRCGLAVRLRAAYMTLERCPRCLAQDCVPVPMHISDGPWTEWHASDHPSPGELESTTLSRTRDDTSRDGTSPGKW